MWPSPVTLPGFELTVRPAVLLLVLCVVVCVALAPRWISPGEGLAPWRIRLLILVLGVAVFAGGRLHFLLNHWSYLGNTSWSSWRLYVGSIHAGGAIVALALTAPWLARALHLPLGRLADGLAPTVGIGVAIARLGCFAQGCCFGRVCTLPWCVSFPASGFVFKYHAQEGLVAQGASQSAALHPLQLYFAAGGLLLTAVAVWLLPRRRYDGQVAWVVLVLYGLSAAVLEFFRADAWPRAYWGPLPQLEWTALAITVLGCAGLLHAERVHRRHALSA